MKEFDFLKKHPYYKFAFASAYSRCYQFELKENDVYFVGIITLPEHHNRWNGKGEIGFNFSSSNKGSGIRGLRDTPQWFQDIYRDSKEKYLHITRIRKIVGGVQ